MALLQEVYDLLWAHHNAPTEKKDKVWADLHHFLELRLCPDEKDHGRYEEAVKVNHGLVQRLSDADLKVTSLENEVGTLVSRIGTLQATLQKYIDAKEEE